MARLIRTDRNGTKYYEGMVTCDRCGGLGGHDVWKFTGWKCYKCGGEGKVEGKWKEYTPEYEAKLKARREARAEKMRPIWEAQEAERKAKEEADRKAREEAEAEHQRKIEEEKAKSEYIGQVGEKIEINVTLKKSIWYEAPSFRGFGTETRYIHIFKDGDNTLIWKTWNGIGKESGETLTIKGTIKEHNEYEGEKQTILTRCKVA